MLQGPGGRFPPGPAHACRRGDRRPAHVGCAAGSAGAPCVLPGPTAMRPALTFEHRALLQTLIFKLLLLVFGSGFRNFITCVCAPTERSAPAFVGEKRESTRLREREHAHARVGGER